MLTAMILVPLIGGIVALFAGQSNARQPQRIAGAAALITVVLAVVAYFSYDQTSSSQFQLVDQADWIPQLGISYHVGVDALSLMLVLMTVVVTALVIVLSGPPQDDRANQYFFWLMALESAVIGVFVSLDLVLFYVFFEVMLVPMYFIIGGWGSERAKDAAVKFFLYTLVGSLLMLAAIIVVRAAGQSNTFDLVTLMKSPMSAGDQALPFLTFALAFAIKTPIFPFHTWLPDAYIEAPTGGSIMLAAVLSKVGAYGFLRFCLGLFPQAAHEFSPLVSILAVITILYAAWAAIWQRDLKALISYSSLGHLGLIVLGIFALNASGIEGSTFQMVNHGITTTALFLIVAAIAARWGTREIPKLAGMQAFTPALAAVLLIAFLSSMPLPGLNGFPGEFLILRGVFAGHTTYAYGILGALGVILSATYFIWMYARIIYTAPAEAVLATGNKVSDITRHEWYAFVPAIVLIFALGVVPGLILSKTGPSAGAISTYLAQHTASVAPAALPALSATIVSAGK